MPNRPEMNATCLMQYMLFTDLMLHTHLVSYGLEPIGIRASQHLRSHTLGNWLNPLFERLALFGGEPIDG